MLSIGEMARKLGVSVTTLRRWDRAGKLRSSSRTMGNHRRYVDGSSSGPATARKTILYACVSSHDQKPDLERQKQRLLDHAQRQGWAEPILISDLGSGLNYRKSGLLRLLRLAVAGQAERIVVENRDRLLRFGAELVGWICGRLGTSLVVVEDRHQEEVARKTSPATCWTSSRSSPPACTAQEAPAVEDVKQHSPEPGKPVF